MARVFVTGSADGLGLMAAQALIELGHKVTLHARNDARAEVARKAAPGAGGSDRWGFVDAGGDEERCGEGECLGAI